MRRLFARLASLVDLIATDAEFSVGWCNVGFGKVAHLVSAMQSHLTPLLRDVVLFGKPNLSAGYPLVVRML